MTMTAAEKQQVLDFLDELDSANRNKVLANLDSFTNWLRNSLYSIYEKVKNAIINLFTALHRVFG